MSNIKCINGRWNKKEKELRKWATIKLWKPQWTSRTNKSKEKKRNLDTRACTYCYDIEKQKLKSFRE